MLLVLFSMIDTPCQRHAARDIRSNFRCRWREQKSGSSQAESILRGCGMAATAVDGTFFRCSAAAETARLPETDASSTPFGHAGSRNGCGARMVIAARHRLQRKTASLPTILYLSFSPIRPKNPSSQVSDKHGAEQLSHRES